jgi:hypothetical protein
MGSTKKESEQPFGQTARKQCMQSSQFQPCLHDGGAFWRDAERPALSIDRIQSVLSNRKSVKASSGTEITKHVISLNTTATARKIMSGDGGNSGALVNDPVDVIIDKLLRYVNTMKFTRKGSCNALFSDILHANIQACVERGTHSTHRHS